MVAALDQDRLDVLAVEPRAGRVESDARAADASRREIFALGGYLVQELRSRGGRASAMRRAAAFPRVVENKTKRIKTRARWLRSTSRLRRRSQEVVGVGVGAHLEERPVVRPDVVVHELVEHHENDVPEVVPPRIARGVPELYPHALAADALMCLERAADVAAFPWGGHARAERVRIITGRPETLGEPWEEGGGDDALGDEALGDAAAASASSKGAAPPADSFRALASDTDGAVVFLDVRGNFVFDAADHRDFLGAVLGTGIERDRIGDIYVNGERGAAVLCAPEMASFLQASLGSVRSVPVTCVVEPLSSLRLPPARRDAFSSIEASMRLDAVASAGFRMSRSKMSALIAAGAVRVNWREGSKPKTVVAAGDVISLRGKGRVEVGDVSETKKGKFQVELVRYL